MELDGRIFLLALQRLFVSVPKIAAALLERAGSAQKVFECDRNSLRECFGNHQDIFELFLKFNKWKAAERDLEKICACGGMVIGTCDDSYPVMLREIHDPPAVLIAMGKSQDVFERPAVAIVGSRLATRRGLDVAAEMAEGLALEGFAVISGMAYGIDAAAHRGAVMAGGPTVAVLGCGCDVDYPSGHQKLRKDVESCGLRISEFPLGEMPYQSNFPQRNRIISGLSLATVVVEAAKKSGSLITARYALEHGREVFAVPGPAGAGSSCGTHQLIRDGAALVECAEDVIMLVEPLMRTRPFLKKSGHLKTDVGMDSPLLNALSSKSDVTIDEIVAKTRMAACDVLSKLTELSLAGIVRELPGRRWRLKGV